MAVDLGALRLLISDEGGSAVLGRLKQLDTAGQKTQATFQKIASAQGAVANQARAGTTAMSRQIGALSSLHRAGQLTNADTRLAITLQQQLTAALNAGNISLQRRGVIAAQAARLQKVTAAPAGVPSAIGGGGAASIPASLKSIGPMFAAQLGLVSGLTIVTAKLTDSLLDSARAYDDAERAQRKIVATSKATGISLDALQQIADKARAQFKLSATEAGELATSITRLASDAGRLEAAGDAMQAFLDIGASRGMTATNTLYAVRQALLGIDEGTDKLFGKNPSTLWKEYADAIGTTVGRLTDAQKKQAVLDAAFRDGARVQGEYAKFMGSAAGASSQAATAAENLKVSIGKLFAGMRTSANIDGAATLNWLSRAIDGYLELETRLASAIRLRERFNALFGIGPDPDRQRFGNTVVPIPNGTPVLPPVDISGAETDAEKIAKAMEAARQKALQQRSQEIRALQELAGLQLTQASHLERMAALESDLTGELERGNLSYAERVDRIRDLLAVQDARMTTLSGAGAKVPTIAPPPVAQTPSFDPRQVISPLPSADVITEQFRREGTAREAAKRTSEEIAKEFERQQLEASIAATIGAAISSGIINGFAQGLASGDVAGAFKDLAGTILSGFGSMLVDLGVKAIMASALMQKIVAALASLNPFVMLAAGTALVALGAAMKGGGKLSGGVSSAPHVAGAGMNDVTRLWVNDRGATTRRVNVPDTSKAASMANPVVIQLHTVNPNDPATQRLLTSAVRAGERRGM